MVGQRLFAALAVDSQARFRLYLRHYESIDLIIKQTENKLCGLARRELNVPACFVFSRCADGWLQHIN